MMQLIRMFRPKPVVLVQRSSGKHWCSQHVRLQNRFSLLALDVQGGTSNTSHTKLPLERNDVWDVYWATDDPQGFAIMEKTKLSIVSGIEAEPPVPTLHYPLGFANLEVSLVDLDAIMQVPEVRLRSFTMVYFGVTAPCEPLLCMLQIR